MALTQSYHCITISVFWVWPDNFKIRNPLSQILQNVLDKNMHDIATSFLFQAFNQDMSFYSWATFFVLSNLCQKKSFVAAVEVGHPVFNSSATIQPFHRLHFHYAGLEWLSTIQYVFKTQIRRKARKWGDLHIGRQSCWFFKVFSFWIFFKV